MSNSAFERYAHFIQEYIYRKRWTDLREVQAEACDAIMDTNKHVIVASGTASGKTEAAFFPTLIGITLPFSPPGIRPILKAIQRGHGVRGMYRAKITPSLLTEVTHLAPWNRFRHPEIIPSRIVALRIKQLFLNTGH